MMTSSAPVLRIQRFLAERMHRQAASRSESKPIVSFTFDDFPRTAATVAAPILDSYGIRGTYYVSAGLMEATTLVGEMFHREDLDLVARNGHELACHTLNHSLCCNLSVSELTAECRKNRDRVAEMFPGRRLKSFSFPEGVVTPAAKAALSREYGTCRTIEPGLNCDPVDLGFLRANRIYSSVDTAKLTGLIRENQAQKGWLIFYTHDVTDQPSRWGCTPKHFEAVVRFAAESGAEILSVSQATERFVAQSKVA